MGVRVEWTGAATLACEMSVTGRIDEYDWDNQKPVLVFWGGGAGFAIQGTHDEITAALERALQTVKEDRGTNDTT